MWPDLEERNVGVVRVTFSILFLFFLKTLYWPQRLAGILNYVCTVVTSYSHRVYIYIYNSLRNNKNKQLLKYL